MLLAVDIGNTDVVLAALQDGHPVAPVRRTPSDTTRDAAFFADELRAFLSEATFSGFDRAVICSVVPPLTQALRAAVHTVTGLEALVVTAALDSGLTLAIEQPDSLGADILAADAAAAEYYPLPVIVFDYGSATTVTVVDAAHCYRGGAIMAGVKLGLQALANGTALLPNVRLCAPERVLSTETTDALIGGAIYGAAAMTDGLIDRIEAELGCPCTAVATGGLAPVIVPHCRRPVTADRDLIFRGIDLLARRNQN